MYKMNNVKNENKKQKIFFKTIDLKDLIWYFISDKNKKQKIFLNTERYEEDLKNAGIESESDS